jgi:hypothetical protein
MRNDRLAEAILSSIVAPERAAAIVGDLVEERRGRARFWMSVAHIALSATARDLRAAPFAMAGAAALAWFPYMALSLLLAMCGYVVVTLAWGLGYVLTHHTGFELLADVLRLRFDWPPVPSSVSHAMQAVVIWAVAPFRMGRFAGQCWRGHEVSISIVIMLMWSAMSVLVPFVMVGVGASLAAMPLIQTFVLLGALSQRHAFARTPR